MDPDPYSEYGSGSSKLLNTDLIRIRIHNTAQQSGALPMSRHQILFFTGGMRWSCSAAEVIFSNRLFSTFFSLGKVIPVVRGWGAHQPGLDFLIGTWRRYPIGLFPIVRSWAELVPDVQVLSRSSELMIKDPSVRMLFTIPDPHYGKPPGSGSAWRMRIRIQGNKRIQILAINGSRRK